MGASHTVLNRIGEFRSKTLEKRFTQARLAEAVRFSRVLVLGIGLAYALMGVFDPLQELTGQELARSIVSRGIVLLLAAGAFFLLKKRASYEIHVVAVSLFEVLAFLAYMVILIWKQRSAFNEQAFAVLLFVWAVTLIQTRWIVSMLVALFYCVFFLTTVPLYISGLTVNMLAEVGSYLLCALILSGISSFRIGSYQRNQFLRECQLEVISHTDKLTGACNRQKLDEVLSEWCRGAECFGGVFSIVLFDIDNFKQVNDTYGHLVGDEVLIELADLVRRGKRTDDVFARWGGEEFILLLPGLSLTNALEVAERLREQIAGYAFVQALRIACSFGVTVCQPQDTPVSLLNRVDALLYRAKAGGKNRVVS